MEFLPIFLKLEGRQVLLVGGGDVAARKIELLRRAGAHIRVVAPALTPSLVGLDGIEYRAGLFRIEDLDGVELVVAATDDRAVNAAVAAEARLRHLPVNVVDDPALCSFIMPAIVDRGRVVVAISTGGASPVLARIIRGRIELALPRGIDRLADLAAAWRARVKAALPDGASRRRFWEALLGGAFTARILNGKLPDPETELTAFGPAQGKLARIDVPHDPEALTLRAVRLLQSADLVLHDPAVPASILEFARRDAHRLPLTEPGRPMPEAASRAIADGQLVVMLIKPPAPRRWAVPRRNDRIRWRDRRQQTGRDSPTPSA